MIWSKSEREKVKEEVRWACFDAGELGAPALAQSIHQTATLLAAGGRAAGLEVRDEATRLRMLMPAVCLLMSRIPI